MSERIVQTMCRIANELERLNWWADENGQLTPLARKVLKIRWSWSRWSRTCWTSS